MNEDLYAVRCYLNGERKLTHELSEQEAANFLIAAKNLVKYLEDNYNG